MAGVEVEYDGVLKSFSNSPPTHYTVKVELFTMVTEIFAEDGYESSQFEAGGHKWKLVLYPNGNKKRNVGDHISLYLVIAETDSLPAGWEVHVDVRLFFSTRIRESTRFLKMLMQSKNALTMLFLMRLVLINSSPLKILLMSPMDLFDDTCVYGAEVFVCKQRRSGKGECLRKIRNSSVCKHVWKIDNFSKLDAEYYYSESFDAGGYQWRMLLYPKGYGDVKDKYPSLFLKLGSPKTLPPGSLILADYTLRILDQIHGRHYFMPIASVRLANRLFILLEVEITVRGITRVLWY